MEELRFAVNSGATTEYECLALGRLHGLLKIDFALNIVGGVIDWFYFRFAYSL